MERLRVAVFGSLQDTNKFSDPSGKPTDELKQMAVLVNQLLVVNGRTSGTSGIYMRAFGGKAYSDGDWRANLKAQLAEGHRFLDGAPAGVPTVGLNLHTDGVGYTHVGYYWDGRAPGSKELGADIAYRIGPLFSTAKVMSADYGLKEYYFASEMIDPNGSRPHRPVLLEIGDHLVAADNLVVATKGDEIAARIVDGLVNVFRLPTQPPVVEPPVVVTSPLSDKLRSSAARLRAEAAALDALAEGL